MTKWNDDPVPPTPLTVEEYAQHLSESNLPLYQLLDTRPPVPNAGIDSEKPETHPLDSGHITKGADETPP